jgi:hypothetical protein
MPRIPVPTIATRIFARPWREASSGAGAELQLASIEPATMLPLAAMKLRRDIVSRSFPMVTPALLFNPLTQFV